MSRLDKYLVWVQDNNGVIYIRALRDGGLGKETSWNVYTELRGSWKPQLYSERSARAAATRFMNNNSLGKHMRIVAAGTIEQGELKKPRNQTSFLALAILKGNGRINPKTSKKSTPKPREDRPAFGDAETVRMTRKNPLRKLKGIGARPTGNNCSYCGKPIPRGHVSFGNQKDGHMHMVCADESGALDGAFTTRKKNPLKKGGRKMAKRKFTAKQRAAAMKNLKKAWAANRKGAKRTTKKRVTKRKSTAKSTAKKSTALKAWKGQRKGQHVKRAGRWYIVSTGRTLRKSSASAATKAKKPSVKRVVRKRRTVKRRK